LIMHTVLVGDFGPQRGSSNHPMATPGRCKCGPGIGRTLGAGGRWAPGHIEARAHVEGESVQY